MKRCHELSVAADPSPLGVFDTGLLARDSSSDAKTTRQISKRRRVVGPNAWDGASRLNSALQDINNLSHRSPISLKDFAVSRSFDSQPTRTTPSTHPRRTPSLSRPAVPSPMSEPVTPALHDSTPERDIEPEGTRLPPSVQPNNSDSIRFNSPSPRFISDDNPVRIKQLQRFQHVRATSQHKELDSDSEDEDEPDEVTDDGNVDGSTEETPEDTAERGVVENRYADINRLLGNLFLSRHRNRA